MKSQDRLEFALFRGLAELMRFGSAPASADLLAMLGIWTGRILCYRRRVVLRQLAMVYPDMGEEERARLADRIYQHLGRSVAEILDERAGLDLASVRIDPGWEPLDAALGRGRGAIVATGHIGNFELGGAVLAGRYRLLDVVKPQRNRLFDDFINERRRRRGILTVAMDRSGPRVLKHLRAGGVVSLLLDQDAGSGGVPVDFMGHAASTWPGVARLSLRTGAPVVPMALLRQTDHSHRLMIREPLFPAAGQETSGEIRDYLQRISLAVEGLVREHPEQWLWVHRRWKSTANSEVESKR